MGSNNLYQQDQFKASPTLNATPVKSPPVGAPYPVYDALVHLQYLPLKSIVISPPSVPLSATSSVTNLNLNQADIYHSQSENNLAVHTGNKFGHNRSVSSTSSFSMIVVIMLQ